MSQDEEFEEIRQLEIDELNLMTSEGRVAYLKRLFSMQAPISLMTSVAARQFGGRVPIIEQQKRRHRRGYSRASGGIRT